MAEIQGPKALDRDIGARLLRPRIDMKKELAHYHPDGEAIVTAFVRGVNAYVELTRENPELLPIEFDILNIEPQPWTPEIVVSRLGGIYLNAEAELLLTFSSRLMDAEKIKWVLAPEPGDVELVVADGFNPELNSR